MAYIPFTLGGVVFDTDPKKYVLPDFPRRGSVHELVDGGGTIIQDKGVVVGDAKIKLSGEIRSAYAAGQFIALYVAIAATYTFGDDQGNVFTVAFEPGEGFVLTPIPGAPPGVFEYTMILRVISITNWLGLGSFPV